MPEFLHDPSVLTKERLKSELVAHSVRLPLGDQRKDVYVQLYLQHLTARNARRSPDFSSDEDEGPAPGPGPGRPHRKATKKTDKTSVEENNFIDVTQLTDENLKEQLIKYGYSVGPIVATTRKVYERKLEQLMDQASAAAEENQPNGSTDSDQYSDTEEEVIVAKELFPSKTKTPVTRQRKTDCSRVEQKEVVKDNLLEEVLPNQAPAPTGISATCRKPIRGAAGRPVEFTYKDALPRRPVPKVQPLAQVKPEKSKSQRSVPIWVQIAVLLIVAFFLFLVYQAMETNKGNPFHVIPEAPKQMAGTQ
ncbi:lamina-associated polypeptide 2, isoforms beta/delta/epsilon/gamma-like [Pristis pectinata]|uniref:lamina-associated polypeptide 2, isoforms beta/delta/epsilon/gamma-like n=1 Tax=Pristis pectinata TaxID=685728 RepID=UPI00223E67CC|nr:lamina-associated polypeptide 2, isoforms beta/delta/epsilon/gamma-like [Pristis pectinata]